MEYKSGIGRCLWTRRSGFSPLNSGLITRRGIIHWKYLLRRSMMKLRTRTREAIAPLSTFKNKSGTRRLKRYFVNSFSKNEGNIVRCDLIRIYQSRTWTYELVQRIDCRLRGHEVRRRLPEHHNHFYTYPVSIRGMRLIEDWIALRFRKVDYIKKITRRESFALTEQAKKRATGKWELQTSAYVSEFDVSTG